jgi:hypothetical protein
LRRVLIFSILVIVLAVTFRLSQLVDDWHYVVPAEPGALLYASTFTQDADAWQQDEGLISSEVRDGTIRLAVNEANTGIYSAVSPYFGDFDLSMDARAVEGEIDNGFGVVFRRKDPENYYSFIISSDGYYRVLRRVDNETQVLHNWHTTDRINQGLDVVNRLRVVGHEDHFQFYINETLVELCIPNNPDGLSTPLASGECLDGEWTPTLVDDSITFGRVGVTVLIDNQPIGPVVEFDNVLIYGSQPLNQNE